MGVAVGVGGDDDIGAEVYGGVGVYVHVDSDGDCNVDVGIVVGVYRDSVMDIYVDGNVSACGVIGVCTLMLMSRVMVCW